MKRNQNNSEIDDTDIVVLSSDDEASVRPSPSDEQSISVDSDTELPGDFPPVEVCAERCRKFAEVTDTNEALAQFYLQDRNWNLERSIQEYYEDLAERNRGEPPPKIKSAGETSTATGSEVVRLSSSDDDESYEQAVDQKNEELSDDLMKVISWNIDGLDPKNVELRTNNVCSIIKRAQADIAMLQEVTPVTLNLIQQNLESDYHILHSGLSDYFTAILVHKKRIKLGNSRVFEFSSSSMGRKLQVVEVSFKKRHSLFILNTHLESTAEFSDVRKEQLRKCFRNINKIPTDTAVLFAGDLNLRDKELDEIGGIPPGIVDVWAEQGSRPEARYTWDMTRNDNLLWNGSFRPKCRFDRMYYRKSASQETQLRPAYFGLIGIERLLPHRCFPSDHWGLYAHFRLI